jgi:hypothetical protein
MRLIAVFILAATLVSPSRAADVDWKVWGGTEGPPALICFYDANGAVRTPESNIRVWTKCLPAKEFLKVSGGAKKKIVDLAVQKLKAAYRPPLLSEQNLTSEQIAGITRAEVTANVDVIEPRVRKFIELNCRERMLRSLSSFWNIDGRLSEDRPSEWKYIAPQTNPATLAKLLCPTQ